MSPLDPMSAVTSSLVAAKLIPDILPESYNFIPTILFSAVWPNGSEAILGNELARDAMLEEPDIVITPMGTPDATAQDGSEETTYTLVMLDPDAPSRADPKFKEFRHWVITGLKSPAGTSIETKNLVALKTKPSATSYRPPGPPPGSGLHRYTFLLFEEPAGGFTLPSDAPEHHSELEARRSWTGYKFGENHGLKLVGANYVLVRSTE
ncbi:hypothetical protein HGRIS_014323 [Hohenbuehelia grisea]|uniref:PEBP-like protein n=1 Tax=Hohenbuehelia grisea TaxID=104357 RepID=A0ABR3JT85_9AGAR